MTRLLRTAAASLLLTALAAGPALAAQERFPDMASGRYDVLLDGMLCHTCLAAILTEVSSLKEVAGVSGDFDKETLTVTIRPKATLTSSRLQKALRRAAKKVDLGTKFELRAVRYKVK